MCEEKSQSQTNTLDNQTDVSVQPSVGAPVTEENTAKESTQADASVQSSATTQVTKESQAEESTSPDPVTSLKGEWIKVCLEPIVTLAQLSDLHEQLCQCLGSRVQLCGAKVERIDTAALQLLLAFWNRPDVTVGWVEPSPELCSAARLLKLSSHLGLPAQEVSFPLDA